MDLEPLPLPLPIEASSSSSKPSPSSKQTQKRKGTENGAEIGSKKKKRRAKNEPETEIVSPPGLEDDIEEAILSLAQKRGLSKTFCPRYAPKAFHFISYPCSLIPAHMHLTVWTLFQLAKLFD